MKKAVALALLAVGVVLLIWGISTADSPASEISEFFTGSPTDKALVLIGGGIVALVVGFGTLVFSGRPTR